MSQHSSKSEPEYSFEVKIEEEDNQQQEEDFFDPLAVDFLSDGPKGIFSRVSDNITSFADAEQLFDHLDQVDVNLIAMLNVEKLFNGAPTFARPILQYALEGKDPLLFPRSQQEGQARRRSKGLPRDGVRDLMAKAFDMFLKSTPSNPLYVKDHKLARVWSTRIKQEKWEEAGYANIFVVNKSQKHRTSGKPLQRIVTDCRLSNSTLQNPIPMEIFMLEALIKCVGQAVETTENSYYVSADLRHWFHQIPMPERYRIHYGIRLQKDVVFPRTWVMGASPSAGIGNAATWSILLRNIETDKQRRISLGIEWTGNFNNHLQWLPLKNGGGVFVLIDNIFVVTSDYRVAQNWQNWIKESAADVNAKLKNDEVLLQTISKNNKSKSDTVEFTGIHFSADGRRAREPIKINTTLEDKNSTSWSGTYRQLASILGQALWIFRVRGLKMCQQEHFAKVYKHAYPQKGKSWDSTTTIANPEDLESLKAIYSQCKSREWFKYDLTSKKASSVVYAASDAFLDPQKGGRGFVWQADYGPHQTTHVWKKMFERDTSPNQIAYEELRAVIDLVEHINNTYSSSPQNRPDVIMLGIDSMHVRGMIRRGMAKTEIGRELLRDLFFKLGSTRLFLHFVKSEDNPADAPSRDKPVDEKLWKDLLLTLRDLVPLALERFERTGKDAETLKNRSRED